MALSWHQTLLRLAVALALGLALGAERELRGQEAGLKTHVLVCLGACLFTLEGVFGFPVGQASAAGGILRLDISRVTSQIVVGIGFLGGGVIMRKGPSVKGLTTAAGLWVAAAVGVACGLGNYVDAGIATGFVLFTFTALRAVELRLKKAGLAERSADSD